MDFNLFVQFTLLIVFILYVNCVPEQRTSPDQQQQTLQDARNERQKLISKYMKKLNKEEGAIKLVGGRNEYEGNVEILHNGKWGAICDDEWDKNEAEVVCRQLGFPGLVKLTHSGMFGAAKRK